MNYEKGIAGGYALLKFVPLTELGFYVYYNNEGKPISMPGNRRLNHGDIVCSTFILLVSININAAAGIACKRVDQGKTTGSDSKYHQKPCSG